MKRVWIGLAVVALVVSCAARAAADGRWTTYIRAIGMTDVEAGSDSVWIATAEAGLLLYDRRTGSLQQVYHEYGGLGGNAISAVALDRTRRLWVGTLGGGLSRLGADGRWSQVNTFDGLPSDQVTVVKAYGDSVWIGTDSGLAFWDGTEISGRLPDGVNPSPFASDAISGIAMVGDSVWVATGAGTYLGRMSEELRNWPAHDEGLASTEILGLAAAGNQVFCLAVATVWLRTDTAWVPQFGPGSVYRIAEDHGVLLASSETGLWRWNGAGWTLVDGALASSSSTNGMMAAADDGTGTVFAAANGELWVPGSGGSRTSIVVPGPVDNFVVNVIHDGRAVFMTTRSNGGGWLRDGTWSNYPSAVCSGCPSDQPYYLGNAYALAVDRQLHKWFWVWATGVEILDDDGATPVWTHLWDPHSNDYEIASHRWGWSTAVDSAGNVWVGGDSPCITLDCGFPSAPRGIDVYGADGTYLRNYQRDSTSGMPGDQVRALSITRDGTTLWAGFSTSIGAGGVAQATIPRTGTPGSLTFESLAALTGLNSPTAMNVFGLVVHGDSVWVMSEDSLRLIRNFKIQATYEKLGPVAEPVAPHPLEVSPDGTVWCAADGGVRVFHPGGTIEDLTTANSALANSRVHSVRWEPGSSAVWFATEGGLNRYDPAYVAPLPPRLSHLAVHVYPNPVSLSTMGFALHLTGEGTSYQGAVFGIDGRKLRTVAVAANGALVWDGRDEAGALVQPGVYFVRVAAGGRTATTRVVVLR